MTIEERDKSSKSSKKNHSELPAQHEIFSVLNEKNSPEDTSYEQLQMFDRVQGKTNEIIQQHSKRIGMPINVTYEKLTNSPEDLPFQMMDNWDESWEVMIKISVPTDDVMINMAMYPFIIHHELSHVYNDEYKKLRSNRLNNEEIKQLNDIHVDRSFGNPDIETGIREVVTDLTALQIQQFNAESRLSFLTGVERLTQIMNKKTQKKYFMRDCIRFKSIIIALKDRFPPSHFTDTILAEVQKLYTELLPLYSSLEVKYIEETADYMEDITQQFFVNKL